MGLGSTTPCPARSLDALRRAEEAGAGRRELTRRHQPAAAAELRLGDRVAEHSLCGEHARRARREAAQRLGERHVLDHDPWMLVGVALDAPRPGVRDADRGEPAEAVARRGERAVEGPVRGEIVQRREHRRLAGVVEDARDARREVELRAKAVERRRRVACHEDRVGGRGRLACRGRKRVARLGQGLGVERRVLLDLEAVLARQATERPARGGGDLRADPCPARQATTYVRRAVIGIRGRGWAGHGAAPLARCVLGTHLWCGLGRRVRRRRARGRRSP